MTNGDKRQTYMIIQMIVQFFIETFGGIIVGYLLGKTFDNWLFEDKQLFVYILMIIGIFAGIRNLIVRALRFSGGDKHEKKD